MTENKEKVMVFFSDISGTFNLDLMSVNNPDIYNEIKVLLEQERRKLGLDKIIFCFITADERINLLLNYVKIFQDNIETDNIVLGLQFYMTGEIKLLKNANFVVSENYGADLKENKIKKYVDELKKEYIVSNVIFADDFANFDTETNLKNLLNDNKIETAVLIPSAIGNFNNKTFTSPLVGIGGLTECIKKYDSYIDDTDKRKIK